MTKRKITKQAEEQEAMIRCMAEFKTQTWMKTVGYEVAPPWLYDLYDSHIRELFEYGYVGMRP